MQIIYYSVLQGQVERSYTEFRVASLTGEQKEQVLSLSAFKGIKFDMAQVKTEEIVCPGFAIDVVSH